MYPSNRHEGSELLRPFGRSQKAIFITGSSSRLGRATAKLFASKDAKATYTMRLEVGDEAFRKAMSAQFFGKLKLDEVWCYPIRSPEINSR